MTTPSVRQSGGQLEEKLVAILKTSASLFQDVFCPETLETKGEMEGPRRHLNGLPARLHASGRVGISTSMAGWACTGLPCASGSGHQTHRPFAILAESERPVHPERTRRSVAPPDRQPAVEADRQAIPMISIEGGAGGIQVGTAATEATDSADEKIFGKGMWRR